MIVQNQSSFVVLKSVVVFLESGICFWRQIHMNSFDTVFVQFFDYKANLIFSRDMISNFRKSVQMLNDKSSERVIIFRFQFCSEIVIEVIQIHRTFYNIFLIIDFLDQLFFCFIVFIADLTYNLLQNIFQSNDTRSLSILVQWQY